MTNNYECPDCDGWGVSECRSCGHEHTCEECHGTGVNSDTVSVVAFFAAQKANVRAHGGASWALTENGLVVGRQGGRAAVPVWSLRYADFPTDGGKA